MSGFVAWRTYRLCSVLGGIGGAAVGGMIGVL
jgi:hypothetical protein